MPPRCGRCSREQRELMIAANNSYLLAFDNLFRRAPLALRCALCRLATGGSFAVRQLYTDDDEVLFQAARPLLVNGIEDVVSRAGSWPTAAIFLTLAPIPETNRRPRGRAVAANSRSRDPRHPGRSA